MSRPFVHLHCHSHFSLLDGAGSIDRLVERAASHGMNALAITDHGNLHGALEFYRKCKGAGLNPIIGYEAYIAPGSRHHKEASSMKEASFHLTLLAKNRIGFRNLVKMASAASLEGFYFKPRIDKELLEEFNEGIVCLSGCVSSEFNQAILRGAGGADERHLEQAMETARWFRKLLGERYFLEIMNNGADVQRIALEGTVEISKQLGIPLVATSDCHYVDREDAEAQDVMLCINTGKFRTDPGRMKMDGNQYYLRSPDDMYAAFPGLEDAVARSQEIADGVDIDLELGKRHFPAYTLPADKTADELLRELCEQGLRERYAGQVLEEGPSVGGASRPRPSTEEETVADRSRLPQQPMLLPNGEFSQVVRDRLERELEVISKLGFSNYFLICWDFVRYARERDIPATARGSGVGAIVCYALYLSHVCPIKYDLLFERFLDENRKEAPDIDIDFCKDRRADVMQYVKDKYGEENVAQIGTFGTLAARAAIRDVGRVLGIPLARVNQIVAMVPEVLNIKLAKALETSDDLKKTYDGDGEIREVIDLALKVEGLARNVGTHAAAVVIADRPLTEYVPLGRVGGKTDIITQWSMNDVEAAGLLKMDFLGLRNLTILSKTVELIEQTTGERVDPYKFPLDDQETFALLQRGETKGIFQLESGGIRDLLQKMKPDHFRDVIATNALYRPGPLEGGMVDEYVNVKNGRKAAEYKHPVLEEILSETHGVMVYQEQVMRIINRLGGVPLANAYTCIKAISKKKESIIADNEKAFLEGAVANGFAKKDAVELWEMILKFAGYGFNKSHSTAYALIAYMTAYLKAHYPQQFMAALLSGDIAGRNFKRKDQLVEHMEDCQRMEIEVVPPNVNSAGSDFTVTGGKIHFALSAIKGCGGGAADAIVAARRDDGPFRDIFDFCERVDAASCNRSTIETLIKAGAMDSFGGHRAQLLAAIDRAMQSGAAAAADRKSGQMSLFGGEEESQAAEAAGQALPDVAPLEDREKLLMEREVLGFYLTSHPLAEHQETLATFCQHTTNSLEGLPDRAEVVLGGMLSSLKFSHTKNARPGKPTKYVMFDLEDTEGVIRCILWPDDFEKYAEMVQPDAILLARGALDRRGGDEANLIINELVPLDQLDNRFTKGVLIRLDGPHSREETLHTLREILRAYPGHCDLQLLLSLDDGQRVKMRCDGLRVGIEREMRQRVDDLLGPGNLKLLTGMSESSGP